MFDGTEDWCKFGRKTDLCFLKILVYKLKTSDFILESKMAELSWKENITPTYIRDSSWDKSMLFHSKKALLLPSVWPGTEYTWALIWKKSLLIFLKSTKVFPIIYSHTGRVDRNLNILPMLMANINPICKR